MKAKSTLIFSLSIIISTIGALQLNAALTRVPGRMINQPGMIVAYTGSSEPDWCLFPYGQTVSTTTYSRLYALIGTTYNTGGEAVGSFRLPDLRGRSVFGKDNMGGSTASRVTNAVSGITGTTLGAAGGDERLHAHTHTQAAHTHAGTTANNSGNFYRTDRHAAGAPGSPVLFAEVSIGSGEFNHTHTFTTDSKTPVISNNTEGGTTQNIPPAMILNWCITI